MNISPSAAVVSNAPRLAPIDHTMPVGAVGLTHEELVLGAACGPRRGYATLDAALAGARTLSAGTGRNAVAVVLREDDRFHAAHLNTRSFDPARGEHGGWSSRPAEIEGQTDAFIRSIVLDGAQVAAVVDGATLVSASAA